MSQSADNETAYGRDQDREEPKITAPGWRDSDLNPDDFGPDTQGGTEINPDTGTEYGEIDDHHGSSEPESNSSTQRPSG